MIDLATVVQAITGSGRAIPTAYYQPLPPAVADDPFAFAVSLSGLMTVTLVFADWVHRHGWAMIDKPEALNHPRTVWRLILFLTGLSGVIRNGPNVLQWGLWKGITPATRFAFAHWDRMLDGVSAPFQIAAGLLALGGTPVIVYQLNQRPIPIELYPGWRKMTRPIAIGFLSIILAFVIAFMG